MLAPKAGRSYTSTHMAFYSPNSGACLKDSWGKAPTSWIILISSSTLHGHKAFSDELSVTFLHPPNSQGPSASILYLKYQDLRFRPQNLHIWLFSMSLKENVCNANAVILRGRNEWMQLLMGSRCIFLLKSMLLFPRACTVLHWGTAEELPLHFST